VIHFMLAPQRMNESARPSSAQMPITFMMSCLYFHSARKAAIGDQHGYAFEGPAEGRGGGGLGPEGMPGEEGGQVEDHADHGGGDAGQRRGELDVVARGLDQRSAGDDEQEAGQEGKEGRHPGTRQARGDRAAGHRLGHAAEVADPGDDHDQRPRSGFAQRQAVHHLRAGQPGVLLDAALIDIGQHGIGTADGEEGGLGEELAHVVEVGTAAQRQQRRRADGDEGRQVVRASLPQENFACGGGGVSSSISAGP
jgi:hypothetical protein